MNRRAAFVPVVSVVFWASLAALVVLLAGSSSAQNFACPAGQIDIMKYFTLDETRRPNQFMSGSPNPIYTEVYPNQDFATSGYWFWLKSPSAHGFDVKAFDQNYVYMRATELNWTDNSSFKRFIHDLPIAARCITSGKPGPEIKVADTTFNYHQSCGAYKSGTIGTAVNDLDPPILMNASGNLGQVWTRVLHYHYDCDQSYQHCADEEQFYLANGYGLWQWKHYKNGVLSKSALMNRMQQGITTQTLPCRNSYR
ncbi:MAG: hypothetical protein JWO91_16 [Acidobacteriaceae bacterium]|nr:hypothetical protein [Acidobacteriaceae bacterium]